MLLIWIFKLLNIKLLKWFYLLCWRVVQFLASLIPFMMRLIYRTVITTYSLVASTLSKSTFLGYLEKTKIWCFCVFYKYFLCQGTFLVSVIAVILLVTVTNSSITARMPHLLGCRLMTGWEGWTHQRFLPPGRSLILKKYKTCIKWIKRVILRIGSNKKMTKPNLARQSYKSSLYTLILKMPVMIVINRFSVTIATLF